MAEALNCQLTITTSSHYETIWPWKKKLPLRYEEPNNSFNV